MLRSLPSLFCLVHILYFGQHLIATRLLITLIQYPPFIFDSSNTLIIFLHSFVTFISFIIFWLLTSISRLFLFTFSQAFHHLFIKWTYTIIICHLSLFYCQCRTSLYTKSYLYLCLLLVCTRHSRSFINLLNSLKLKTGD